MLSQSCQLPGLVYFAVIECSILQISVRSSQFIVLVKSSISLLICLVFIFIIESEALRFPTIIAKLSISPFNSVI